MRVALTNLWDGNYKGSNAGLKITGLEAVGVAIAVVSSALLRRGSDVLFAFEEHGGIHEDFGDSGEGVLKAVFEKEIDERILVVSLFVFVHGCCCFGLSTSSIWSWTDADNPGGSGGRSALRRTGSQFRYAPSAASAAGLCCVAGFYRRIFTLPLSESPTSNAF